jgi:thiopeptide-type bacteriocin biosynthesis protein
MPIEILAAMNYVQLLDSFGDWDWRQWVLDHYPMELQKTIGQWREQSFALVDPLLRWVGLRKDAGAHALLAVWNARAQAAANYGTRIGLGAAQSSALDSVLHLHANRLIGIDQDAEHVSYGILRTVVRHHVGQLRNAR